MHKIHLITFLLLCLQLQVVVLTTTKQSSRKSSTHNVEQATEEYEDETENQSTTGRQKVITKFVKPESRKVPVDCDKPQYGWTKDELILSNNRCMNPSFCFPWKKNGFRDKKHCRGWCSAITVWVATCVESVTWNVMEI